MIQPTPTTRILRIGEVIGMTGLSRSSIYRLIGNGFPAPVKIGVSAVGWRSADIDEWLAERKPSSAARH